MVKWTEDHDTTTHSNQNEIDQQPPIVTINRLRIINQITELSQKLRLKFYQSKLKAKVRKDFPINHFMKIAMEAYDFALLAQLQPLKAEDHNRKYEELLEHLKSVKFPFFMNSTVHWNRSRKESLGSIITSFLHSEIDHDCVQCFNNINTCNHKCCRQKALDFAIRTGIFRVTSHLPSSKLRNILVEKKHGIYLSFSLVCFYQIGKHVNE